MKPSESQRPSSSWCFASHSRPRLTAFSVRPDPPPARMFLTPLAPLRPKTGATRVASSARSAGSSGSSFGTGLGAGLAGSAAPPRAAANFSIAFR